MKRLAAALLLALAAAAPAAAKPVPAGETPAVLGGDLRDSWRGQAIAACVGRLRPVEGLSPDDLEAICGCAADRFLEGNGSTALPEIGPGRLPPMLQGQTLACTARMRPDRASDVARLGVSTPQMPSPPPAEAPPVDAKPVDDGAAIGPGDGNAGESGRGFMDWVRSLSLPDWLTGASLLWWIALGIFVFGLLVLKLRRRDPRKDLTGPPSSMRRGAPPQPPRRPDLPR